MTLQFYKVWYCNGTCYIAQAKNPEHAKRAARLAAAFAGRSGPAAKVKSVEKVL